MSRLTDAIDANRRGEAVPPRTQTPKNNAMGTGSREERATSRAPSPVPLASSKANPTGQSRLEQAIDASRRGETVRPGTYTPPQAIVPNRYYRPAAVGTEPAQSQKPAEKPRKATLYDMTIGSIKRGYDNAIYGRELYKDMTGQENQADEYAQKMAGDEYNFEAGGFLSRALSGGMELLGQQVRQWTDPLSVGLAGTAATGAAIAGQAGPQVLVPEEVITVPGAFLAGLQVGSTKANFEIEAGHAYKEMLDNGISEETASKIATGVGIGNAALEFVQLDELAKSFKILDKIGADDSIIGAVKRELTRRGVDIAKETAQEVAQEGVTIAGTQIGSKIDTGKWAYDSGDVLGRLGDTAASSALSFGALNVPGGAYNVYQQTSGKDTQNAGGKSAEDIGATFQEMGDDVVLATIQEGLASDPSTRSYQLAQQLQQKLDAGETVTNAELGHLYQANVQAIDAEESSDDLLLRAADEAARKGGVTNSTATDILGNPSAVRTLAQDAGLSLADDMSKAQRRKAVKTAVETLASRNTATMESSVETNMEQATPSPAAPQSVPVQQRPMAAQAYDIRRVQSAAASLGERGAKALRAAYDGSVSADTFYAGFASYYEAGVSGMDMGKVRSEYGAQLSAAQKYAAYVAGQNDAELSLQRERQAAPYAKSAGSDSGLVYDDFVRQAVESGRTLKNRYGEDVLDANGESRVYLTAETAAKINSVAKSLGVRVRFVDSIAVNGKADAANAQITGAEVQLQKDNENPVMFLIGHEMTHRMQELAPKEYRAFRDAAANDLAVRATVEKQMEKYARRGIPISYEAALDEAAADYAGRLIDGGKVLDDFIEKHRDDRTLLEKVRDAIRAIVRKLTGAEKKQAQTAEGKLTAALEAATRQAKTLQGKSADGTMNTTRNSLKEDGENDRKGAARAGTHENLQREARRTVGRTGEADQRVRREFSTDAGRHRGVNPSFGAKPVRSWVEGHTVEPPEGSVAYTEQQTAMDYGVPSFVVADAVWAKNKGRAPAFAAGGQIYFRQTMPEKNRGMFAPHEVTHVMRQVGYKPYLDFVERTPALLNMNDQMTRVLLNHVAEHQHTDMENADPTRLYDEFNATMYGHIAAGKADMFTDGPASRVFYDFAAYAKELAELHERFKADNQRKTRFSLKSPVEETKNLIALHNLTEEKLWGDLRLGGFPMPSIAVTRTDVPHTNFGDITLVMDKRSIDPKANRKNTVYSADAWTPTFPQVEYAADPAAERRISGRLRELSGKVDEMFKQDLYRITYDMEDLLNRYGGEDELLRQVMDNYGLKAAYLEDAGHHVSAATVQREADKGYSQDRVEKYRAIVETLGTDDPDEIGHIPLKELRDRYGDELETAFPGMTKSTFRLSGIIRQVQAYLQDQGGEPVYETVTDAAATRRAIDDVLDRDGYERWVRELYSGVQADSGIYNNKERFTPAGNRRTFKQTHYPVTLENIVKAMKGQNGGNTKNVSGFYGVKSLRAGTAKRFKSIADMHKLEGRLQNLTEEQTKAIHDELDRRLMDITEALAEKFPNGKGSFDYYLADSIGNMLVEIADGEVYTIDAIMGKFNGEYGFHIGNELAAQVRDLLFDVSQMPVNIFEAKPERAVGFDEVLAAVLPDDASGELRDALSSRGVNVLTYKAGDDADRIAKVNGVEGARFSLKEDTVSKNYAAILEENELLREQMKDYIDLQRRNGKLQESRDYWQGQTRRTKRVTTDKKAVSRAARELIRSYGADLDAGDITQDLQSLYDYLASGYDGKDDLTYTEARRRAEAIAEKLVGNAVAVDETYEQYSDLRAYLRSTTLSLSEEDSRDIPDYGDWRKHQMGRMVIRKGHTNIDQVYQEMSELWPEFFDEQRENNPVDQLLRIAEVMDGIYNVEEYNPFGPYMQQAITGAANEIMERFFDLPQTRATFADRQARKLDDTKAKGRERVQKVREDAAAKIAKAKADGKTAVEHTRLADDMYFGRKAAELKHRNAEWAEKVREQNAARLAELRQQNRERTAKAVERERTRRAEQIGKLKQRYREKDAAGRERRSARELRAKIMRHASALSQKLLRPSDKQHIPESLRQAVAAMLESINLESAYTTDPNTGKRVKDGSGTPTKRTEAFRALKEEYRKIISEGGDMVIDPSLLGSDAEGIRGSFDAVLAMGDIRLADMNTEQLATVWQVIKAVEHSVNTAGKILSKVKYAKTADWAQAISIGTSSRRAKSSLTTNHALIDLETPYTFFSHYGEAGKAVYRMLRDAQDQQQLMVDHVAEEVRKIVAPETVKELETTTQTFTTERGEKLTLSVAQVMELYELAKRKKARDHLLKGGVVQPEIKTSKIRRGTDSIRLTEGDLVNITETLTQEQVKIADGLQGLTASVLADYGNKASMEAYGYKKFTESDYWPIKSAKEGLHSNIEKGGNNTRSIKNIGMAKTTMPRASNALDLAGIFTTFANHTSDMTDYASWLCAMEDINRLFNYQFRDEEGNPTGKTIKGLLDRVGGPGSQKYWHNLMEDIQNGINAPGDSPMWDIAGKAIGSFKGAAMGANIRVVIQQPTAFFRAAAVLDPRDMARGLARGVTRGNGWKKALQYSPIAMRKDAGGFDISSPYQMTETLFDNRTNVRKLNDVLSAPAGVADAVTWSKLWNACEWATAREHQGLTKGSEAFYQQTAKLFAEVIDQTQVVDGVLQRSNIMRSSNAVVKQATSFMGEPIMSLNLLMRAYDQVRYEQNNQKRGKAIKTMGRAATALVVTNVVNALAQSLVDAMRDDNEDEKYWERFRTAFTGITGEEETPWEKAWNAIMEGNVGSGMNPLGQIPFVKDALSIMRGYDVSRTEMEVVSDLIAAGRTAIDSADGNGKRTRAYAIKQLLSAGAKMFGIPVSNLTRDMWGLARTAAVETNNIPLQYEMEKAIYNITNTSNKSRYYAILYRALEQGDMDTYRHIRDDLMNSMGVDGASIDSVMRSRYNKAVEEEPDYTLPQRARDLIGSRDQYAPPKEKEETFGADDLGSGAYQAYSDQRANDYRSMADGLAGSPIFRGMDDETRDKVLKAAYDLADKSALEDHSDGQYKITTKWMTLADEAEAVGVEPWEYVLFHVAYNEAETTRDENGDAMKGETKSDHVREWLELSGLTQEQQEFLWGTVYKSEW